MVITFQDQFLLQSYNAHVSICIGMGSQYVLFHLFHLVNSFMAFDPCDLYVGVDFIIHVGLVCNLRVNNFDYVGWNFFIALEIFTLWR